MMSSDLKAVAEKRHFEFNEVAVRGGWIRHFSDNAQSSNIAQNFLEKEPMP